MNPLALAFLALSGAILLLYLLRLKRRRMRISSTYLWSEALNEFQANAPFQWLKKNLLMFLQLLLLLFLVLALARPFFFGRGATGGRTVILVDVSYSMLAEKGGKTRLDRALDEARRVVSGLSRGDQAMVVALKNRPSVLAGFTPDRVELAHALAKLPGELGGAADLSEAMKLLSPLLTAGTRIVLLSDGGFEDISGFSLPDDVVLDFFPVGRETPNAGIIRLNISQRPGTSEYELFAAISSTYPKDVKRTIRLSVADAVIDQQVVVIRAGGTREFVIAPLPYLETPLTIEILEGDGFLVDDVCKVVLPPEKKIPVTLVSEPDVLLESALASDPAIDVVRLSPDHADDNVLLASSGVFIFSGTMPPSGVSFPMLVINPAGQVGGVRPRRRIDSPKVVDWDAVHPVMEFINPLDIRISEAKQALLGTGTRVLVDGSDGPLIVAGEEGYTRYLVTLFNPSESDFPLRASFPIFLHNAAVWLSKSLVGADPYNAAVGRLWRFKVGDDVENAILTPPGGRKIKLSARSGEVGGIELNNVGLWTLDFEEEEKKIAVNLLDEKESSLSMRDAFTIGEVRFEKKKKAKLSRELYPWLIFLALLILIGEWYLYHQRTL